MGTITKRTTKNGDIRYRALIRVMQDGVTSSESRTFSTRTLAQQWLKKREAQIEFDPDSLTKTTASDMRLSDAIIRYLDEMGDNFGRSHKMGLQFIAKLPIGAKYLTKLSNADYAKFAQNRLVGNYPNTKAVSPATLKAVALDGADG